MSFSTSLNEEGMETSNGVAVKQEIVEETNTFSFGDQSNYVEKKGSDDLPFCFENDHVALKGNPDYQHLLRTIVMLEAQRTTAIKDFDKLLDLQQQALTDPIQFVNKLQRNVDLGIPCPQHVVELPSIAWTQYTSNIDAVLNSYNSKHITRLKLKKDLLGSMRDGGKMSWSNPGVRTHTAAVIAGTSTDPVLSESLDVKMDQKSVVRLWTADEQRHLEDLLRKYLPERFEARRWSKIANELHNRTPQQVASRVQKYFIKLAKAGLPIPGRIPNVATYNGKGYHRHQRYNRLYYPSSTFLTSYQLPVFMNDDDCTDDAVSYSSDGIDFTDYVNSQQLDDASDDDSVPSHLKESSEYQELQKLKQLKRLKLADHFSEEDDGPSTSYRATITQSSSRLSDSSPDISTDCATNSVRMKMKESDSHVDTDYTSFTNGSYNYLDPNYLPQT